MARGFCNSLVTLATGQAPPFERSALLDALGGALCCGPAWPESVLLFPCTQTLFSCIQDCRPRACL